MKTIIFLDANFILVPCQMRIDIYRAFEDLVPRPYELKIISAVFDELEKKIAMRPEKSKLKKEYDLCRQILDSHSYELIHQPRNPGQLVDDLILEFAMEWQNMDDEKKVFVATNDKEFRQKCKNKEIRTIFVRQNRLLGISH